MNKYQKALENIGMIDLDNLSNGYDSPKFVKDFYYGEYELLQELVDKAAPKKPIKEENLIDYDEFDTVKSFYNSISSCPNCKGLLFDENDDIDFKESPHCPYCGQRLDWGEEE